MVVEQTLFTDKCVGLLMDNLSLEPIFQPKKRRWLRWVIEAMLIMALIIGVRTWQQRGMLAGEAPNFEQITLAGKTVQLTDYRGKPVLLHFWATWCPMCALEQDSVSALAKDWPVLTVAFQSGDKEEVQRFITKQQLQAWNVIVDEDGKLATQFGVHGVPTSYILDAKGKIRFREVGLTSSWGLRLRLWLATMTNWPTWWP